MEKNKVSEKLSHSSLLKGTLQPTDTTLKQGSIFGLPMAAMMFIPQAILMRSIWTVDFNGIFVLNTIAHLGIGVVVGLIIAYFMK